jgi:hypothetical protein
LATGIQQSHTTTDGNGTFAEDNLFKQDQASGAIK